MYHAGTDVVGRDGNPVWSAFEQALGALEGGQALVFASGIAAISAILDALPGGSVVVAPTVAYSGTVTLLRELADAGRLKVRSYDASDPDEAVRLLPGADLLWLESATNPTMDIADVPLLSAAAHTVGASVVVDATFATPLVQRPLELGADVVVHSATVPLGPLRRPARCGRVTGRGLVAPAEPPSPRPRGGRRPVRDVAGAAWVADGGAADGAVPGERARAGPAAGPAPGRVERASPRAARPPGSCGGEPRLARLRSDRQHRRHGDAANAERVAESTRVWVHATSLGGLESTLERRRRWAAESVGVPETLIRLSVGIEDVEDLWADLDAALR